LPQTISGVFWFKQCEFTDNIFARTLSVYADRLAPTQKWAGGMADEYCFNVALAQVGYKQDNVHFVYFDKTNGNIDREQIFSNYWGIAAGGNRLSMPVRRLYEDLVDMYDEHMNFSVKRRMPDKVAVINERRNY
jgi:hypothetical protein